MPIVAVILVLLLVALLGKAKESAGPLEPEQPSSVEKDLCKLPLYRVSKRDISTFWNRISPYEKTIWDTSKKFGVDYYLVLAVIWTESSGNPGALRKENGFYSYGLMQITYNAAKDVGFADRVELLMDPDTNILYGTKYLALKLSEWKNPVLAIAAYNAGTRRVKSWIERGLALEDFPNWEYVKRVASYYCTLSGIVPAR